MIKNRIINIDNHEKMQSIIRKAISDGINVVELDGTSIQSRDDYLEAIENGFDLPYEVRNDRYLREHLYELDLRYMGFVRYDGWVGIKGHMLVIHNYSEFIKGDTKLKQEIIKTFEDKVLPFWERGGELGIGDEESWEDSREPAIERALEVAKTRAKPFNVYLVD